MVLVGLLSTMSISNVLADDLDTAAAAVFQKLKFAQQPAAPVPAPQAPAPMAPSNPVMPQSPASVALQALTSTPTPLAMPQPPAAPAPQEQEAGPPATITLEADGSGIPPDSLGDLAAGGELDASAGMGNEGTDDGSAAPAE